jgi:phytoene/squalene synthetase
MNRYGVSDLDIASGKMNASLRELLAFEAGRAEDYLRRGLPLAQRMPGRLKIVVGMFAQGGLAILRKLRHAEFDVFTRRPKLRRADIPVVATRAILGLFMAREPHPVIVD